MGETTDFSSEQIRSLRLRAQRLEPRAGPGELVETIRAICGANAQLSPAMMLSLRARIRDLTMHDVQDALAGGRELVRTWAMRGTLHLVAADDAAWLVPLLGPIFAARDSRRRLALGLDDEKCARAQREMKSILKRAGPLTRWELVDRLNERGLSIERKGQAAIHLIALAALNGTICLGPDRQNGEKTFRLAAHSEPNLSTRPAALAELARRYLAGYGPASPKDFASWSGLQSAQARQAWSSLQAAGAIAPVQVDRSVLWAVTGLAQATAPAGFSAPSVRLLPAFDGYLLGYADRSLVVPLDHQRDVYHGGQIVPVILVNGESAGVWRYERHGKYLQITVRPFRPLGRAIDRLIRREVEDIGRFWGMPARL
ncbi:MAG: winged helix DNA-binding domain-containing protein [Rudaea sp.]